MQYLTVYLLNFKPKVDALYLHISCNDLNDASVKVVWIALKYCEKALLPRIGVDQNPANAGFECVHE